MISKKKQMILYNSNTRLQVIAGSNTSTIYYINNIIPLRSKCSNVL